jgi:hypothetical protein
MLLRDLPHEALFAWRKEDAVAFCPRCKSVNVRDSLYRVHDIPALLLGFKPYRCDSCFNRFTLWRLLGEGIRAVQPGMQLALIPNPMPGLMAQAMRSTGLDAMGPASPPLEPLPARIAAEATNSLSNLFAATSQYGHTLQRQVAKKRIVEAEFSASLAQAAMAVGPRSNSPVNSPSPLFRPSTGPENRRKGDRPLSHRSSETPAEKPATSDTYQPNRR